MVSNTRPLRLKAAVAASFLSAVALLFGAGSAYAGWTSVGDQELAGTPVVFTGTHNADGSCSIPGSATATRGETVTLREVAFDLATCSIMYDLVRTAGVKDSAATEATPGMTDAEASGGGTVATTEPDVPSAWQAGYLRVWYDDPVGIDVSVLRLDTETNGCSWKWKRKFSWLSLDGWYLDKSGTDHHGATCSSSWVQSGRWKAEIFGFPLCVPQWQYVWTNYGSDSNLDYDKVKITSGGVLTGSWSDSKGSTFGCDILLGHVKRLAFESPW
jgi:hypothetical protein